MSRLGSSRAGPPLLGKSRQLLPSSDSPSAGIPRLFGATTPGDPLCSKSVTLAPRLRKSPEVLSSFPLLSLHTAGPIRARSTERVAPEARCERLGGRGAPRLRLRQGAGLSCAHSPRPSCQAGPRRRPREQPPPWYPRTGRGNVPGGLLRSVEERWGGIGPLLR